MLAGSLEYGAKLEVRNSNGDTPLLVSARCHTPASFGTLQLLLEAGVNVEVENLSGDRVLLNLIVAEADVEHIRLLLKYGADMNAVARNREQPLHICMKRLVRFQSLLDNNKIQTENRFYNLLDAMLALLDADADIDRPELNPDRHSVFNCFPSTGHAENTLRRIFCTENIKDILEEKITRNQFSEKTSKKLAQLITYQEAIRDTDTPLRLLRLCRRTLTTHIRTVANGNSKEYQKRCELLPKIPATSILKRFIQFQLPVEGSMPEKQADSPESL